MYHRIAEERSDPWRLCVTPGNFADHLEVLRRRRLRLVHVSDLSAQLTERRLPRGTVAISFDDGYRDNLEHGRPLLERYEAPATLFATAGYIGRDEEFWWDVLERTFLQPGSLPEGLELSIDGERRQWSLGDGADLSAAQAAAWRDWKPGRPAPSMRHWLHDHLWGALVDAHPGERARLIAEIRDWAGVDRAARATHRPLDEAELLTLARNGLVEIGAHSLTHPALNSLAPQEQIEEITASKLRLEDILQRPVTGFSYPQGRVDLQTIQFTRSAGYSFACGSVANAVTRRSENYRLPRVVAPNVDGRRFSALIDRYMAA
jgi:peptidoglycan/xylan/chitin deacetylase (PgdA/CDA1 family)